MIITDWWTWKCAICGWCVKEAFACNTQQSIAKIYIREHSNTHAQNAAVAHLPITNAVDPDVQPQPSESSTRARLSVLVNRIEQWEFVPALPPSATEDLLHDIKQCLESILASSPDKESR